MAALIKTVILKEGMPSVEEARARFAVNFRRRAAGTNLTPPQETLSTLVAQPENDAPSPCRFEKSRQRASGIDQDNNRAGSKKPEILVSDNVQTDLESDFDTIDSMNLNKVTDKIREECKTMVKNLHLDHLMDRD